MSVQAYEIIEDCAKKLRCTHEHFFLQAVISRGAQDMVPPNIYANTLYSFWELRNEIPEWLESYCIDLMISQGKKGGTMAKA